MTSQFTPFELDIATFFKYKSSFFFQKKKKKNIFPSLGNLSLWGKTPFYNSSTNLFGEWKIS